MGFPDAMNPSHYKGVNACDKLRELNREALGYTDKMNGAQKLIQASIGNLDMLYVYVPSMLLTSMPGRLGRIVSVINRANYTIADRVQSPSVGDGAVFVLKPLDATQKVCNVNFYEALLAINRALTGNSMVTMLMKYQIDFFNMVKKNPAAALLMGDEMSGLLATSLGVD